jgi:hypothetical protein
MKFASSKYNICRATIRLKTIRTEARPHGRFSPVLAYASAPRSGGEAHDCPVNQLEAALYIHPPTLETTVAIHSIVIRPCTDDGLGFYYARLVISSRP